MRPSGDQTGSPSRTALRVSRTGEPVLALVIQILPSSAESCHRMNAILRPFGAQSSIAALYPQPGLRLRMFLFPLVFTT